MKPAWILGAACVLAAGAALFLGPAGMSAGDVWTGLVTPSSSQGLLIHEVRLPRIVLALILGAALGGAGAVLQGLLRNPLADPGVIGISASAGLGAVLAIGFGLSGALLPLSAMIGAGLGLILLLAIARRGGLDGATLILAGIAVNALAAAATSLVINLAPNPLMLSDMVLWLMGSLAGRGAYELGLVGLPVLAGLALLLATRRGLRAMTLGSQTAATLGIDGRRLTLLALFGTALSVGALVSVTGAIGFVGLVVPHVLRPFVAHDPGRLVPASMLGGALLVLAADTVLRLTITGPSLQLGVVTAFLGAPVFLAIALKRGQSW